MCVSSLNLNALGPETHVSCLCSKASLLYQVSLVRAPSSAHTYAAVGFGRKVEVKAEGGLSKSLKKKKSTHSSEKTVLEPMGSLP